MVLPNLLTASFYNKLEKTCQESVLGPSSYRIYTCENACDGVLEWGRVFFHQRGGIGIDVNQKHRLWFRLPTNVIPLFELECKQFRTLAEKQQLFDECVGEWNTIVDGFLEAQLM